MVVVHHRNRPIWIFWFLLNCNKGNPASFQSFNVYSPKNKPGQMCVYTVDSKLQNNFHRGTLFHKKLAHYKETFFLSVTQTWQPSRFCCETHIFNCPLPVSSWGHNTPVFLPTNFTPFFLPLLVLTTCFWRYTACSVGLLYRLVLPVSDREMERRMKYWNVRWPGKKKCLFIMGSFNGKGLAF